MAEFLDAFDVERDGIFEALGHFETVWERFRERQRIQVDGSDLSDSLISTELALVRSELERANFTIGVFGLIKRVQSLGVTILLIEHDMSLVMKACDRLVVFNFGRKIATFATTCSRTSH